MTQFLYFDEVASTRMNQHALQQMMGLAMLIGGPENAQKISDTINNPAPMFEEDPKWNGVQKIPSSECFLSVGPGALEDQLYPCLMAPKDSPMVKPETKYLDESEDFVVLARLKMGYETADEALSNAGQMMTSVPILKDGEFIYPYYKHDEYVNNPRVKKAIDRRLERSDKRQVQAYRSARVPMTEWKHEFCELCGGFTGHYTWCAK